jgi:uncharacterized protein YihD (DUF1040 family)
MGWSVPWAGQDKSSAAMRWCLSWPKGSDHEVHHLILISSLGGLRQVVCCHAKMSRLSQKKWQRNPSLALLQKWSLHEDDSASPKELLGGPKQVVCCHAKMSQLARRNSLGGPKQIVCCYAKMSRLAQRNSLGGPRQFVPCWNMDEWTSHVLGKLDSLTEWLNKFFGKKPLVSR